jgi:hypothetical protein
MSSDLPFEQHINAGYFRIVERQYNDRLGESHTYTRTLVTRKGLEFIQKRLSSRHEAVGVKNLINGKMFCKCNFLLS